MKNLRLVNIESPFAGGGEQAIAYARACMRDCISRGEAPIASHLLYTQPGVLDDTDYEERMLGIECGFAWNAHAEATVVYTDLGISHGMSLGIKAAKGAGRKLEYRTMTGWSETARSAPSASEGSPSPERTP